MLNIPGYSGYRVSRGGYIYCLVTRDFVVPKPDRDGYLLVDVVSDSTGNIKRVPVHRLVLLAKAGPKPRGLVSRHLDGDKRNNAPKNLVYGTQLENIQDKWAHGTMPLGEDSPAAVLTAKQVRAILFAWNGDATTTCDTLAALYRVHRDTVRLIVSRSTWLDEYDTFAKTWIAKGGKLRLPQSKIKVNAQIVRCILHAYHVEQVSTQDLARRYGVSRICVTNIVAGRSWLSVYADYARIGKLREVRKLAQSSHAVIDEAVTWLLNTGATIAVCAKKYGVKRSTLVYNVAKRQAQAA